jgi:transcriptional regulator with XRE-family HTH domain
VHSDDDQWIRAHRWEVGTRIRRRREELGYSQIHLGELAGIDNKTISRAENGVHAISVDQVAKLAHALNVPSASLLPDDHPPGRGTP